MATRRTIRALVAVAAVLVLAGCGGGGLDAEGVVDELNDVYPLGDPRDNTGFCEGTCEQVITTNPLSVYEWTNQNDAAQFALGLDGTVTADRFVMRYNEDFPASDQATEAWGREFRRIVTERG